MTCREQMLRHQLHLANAVIERLRGDLAEVNEANANLCVERDATDVLLGEAMDLLAKSARKPGRS